MDNTKTPPYVVKISKEQPKRLTLVPGEPTSRYKTRQLQIQVVGRSKMIRTSLLNVTDVAKDMLIPAQYIGQFMGYVIGAQARFDAKKPERERAYLSGEHAPGDLSKVLFKFIQEVLLCPQCGLPEIDLCPQGKKIFGRCRACGGNERMQFSEDKFLKYVLNHPPGNVDMQKTKGKQKGKKNRERNNPNNKAADDEEEEPSKADSGNDEPENSDDAEPDLTEAEKAELDKLASQASTTEWTVDTSEEAARQREQELLPESVSLDQDIKNLLQTAGDAVDVKLREMQSARKIANERFIPLVFNAMFPDSRRGQFREDLTKFTPALTKVIDGKSDIQMLFLESVVLHLSGSIMKQTPIIFKQLYDNDLIEEDAFLKWKGMNKSNDQAVIAVAAPFLNWLEEAEEESEDEEEEE